ncbi:protein CNPPD1 isoform X2 [Drosophila grimshawi]|uniref:protein CNPPD1 isoform X2 n=1 Tax=Drosophila grimshawi TaxID=7222 RepID=UPI000C86F021|nr:protein CNPPD1 isoform X2 [Drosophila grimshawi]
MGWRSKFVTSTPKKVMQHGEFMNRMRKTLYYGSVDTAEVETLEVSRPFAEYAADLFSEPHRGHSLHRLSSIAAGKSHSTPCSLIMALIYLDRLNIIDPGYSYRITPQELFVVSMMISTKLYAGYDERYNFYLYCVNDWAKEGNMTEDKLKEMELEFLTAIDWNIYISNEQFFEKLTSVERTLAEREGLRRGWLTYSELMQLLPDFTIMRFLLNNLAVLALSYAASVFTIAGAFFIASQVPGTLWHRRTATHATAAVSTTITTPIITPNVTEAAPVVSDEVAIGVASNQNCSAMNVEAELLKLEQQYCAEARLTELKRRQRLKRPPNPLLPPNYRMELDTTQQDDTQHWLNIKSQYSDGIEDRVIMKYTRNWDHVKNASIFWQALSDAISHQSFLVRWPELWSKLF